ncbi:glycoside hydrolase family 2 [Novosphingobium umbonatum]|uniref:beta-galactosidase n=1 Tax=Novosphingobium umbonatum TaxID=1908524 RepID=A0A3S2UNR4_9SPHN|nr:glycoside hydrolase family 2 TIM barrel-domain containing protein [Novosphingobium umbonatum]RVU02297.1 glycoside hydrolase family 2 [Novosphingobium umbonatum]
MRNWVIIGSVIAATSLPVAVLAANPSAPTQVAPASANTLSLDGQWQFSLALNEADAQAMAGFYALGYDASRFVSTPVPSNWALQGFEDPHYKPFKTEASQGFYRKDFTVPADWAGKRVLLHFGGVWSSAEVWVNGKPLGRIDSGFTPISFDVTSALKPGAGNLVALRVRQTQPSYLFDTNDDWTLGGIYRSVSLEATPMARWIDRVEAVPRFDAQYRDADLHVRVMVGSKQKRDYPGNLEYSGPQTYQLRATLTDTGGKLVQSQILSLPAHPETGRETALDLHVQKPQQWTAETPNLYKLTVDILDDGKVTHQRQIAVGFREISTKGGVLRVNGQAVKLRGVNRHDEHPDTGRATTPEQWRQDLTLMKAANINYIHLAHYPPATGFLDLCDQLGLYVSDEIPMGSGGDHMDNPALAGAAMLRSYETVARDFNHPSVIIWSVGNEDPLTSLHLAAVRMVKGLDPTRPVLMPWRAETSLPPEIDILAPHYWTARAYDQLAGRADRPIVTTEFTHAYGNDGFGGLDARWKALTKHPSGAGGAIWMWADQGLSVPKRAPDGTTTHSLLVIPDGFDGITDSYRNPTRDYWETQAVYAPVYPAVSALDVVAGQAFARVPVQNDYDFTDLSAIRVAWRLMQDETVVAQGKSALAGPPHAVASLDVPLDGLTATQAAATTYLDLGFSRADGSLITRRSVELRHPLASAPTPGAGTIAIDEKPDAVIVNAGAARFEFDPRKGVLAKASVGEKPSVLGMRPTIWRPLNDTEQGIVRGEKGPPDLPDLNSFTPSVTQWRVNRSKDSVTIHAVVDYRVDAQDAFNVTYDYDITSAGTLNLRYRLAPQVRAQWLPYVGLDFQTAPDLTQLRWLGLGPYDAYPNLQSAPQLGLWRADRAEQGGVKAIRWAEVSGAQGVKIRWDSPGYLAYSPQAPDRLLVLSALLGRPEKGRRPEEPEERLDTEQGKSFSGELRMTLGL